MKALYGVLLLGVCLLPVHADEKLDTSHLPVEVQRRIQEWKGEGDLKKVRTRKAADGSTYYEVDYKERGEDKKRGGRGKGRGEGDGSTPQPGRTLTTLTTLPAETSLRWSIRRKSLRRMYLGQWFARFTSMLLKPLLNTFRRDVEGPGGLPVRLLLMVASISIATGSAGKDRFRDSISEPKVERNASEPMEVWKTV